MNDEYMMMAVNSISHHAQQAESQIVDYCTQPSVLYRPSLSIDGNQWCALYGEDLQSGVAGFGISPQHAMWDFNKNWHKVL
jgi:hypothetical protein